MKLADELHAIVAALRSAGVRHAVCGGVAVGVHLATRAPKDLDIDVIVAPDDVGRVLDAVRPLGYRFVAALATFDAGTRRERTEQSVVKLEGGGYMRLDILLASASLADALDDPIEVQLPRGPLAVVSRATLIRMKQMAGRAQDLIDLSTLERDLG
ncbi:MAG TPA: hypothetical protein VNO30_14390 [Kofleriaceae bacterium]|nr:hypothetical protein [Kofleriaceae bacterium]